MYVEELVVPRPKGVKIGGKPKPGRYDRAKTRPGRHIDPKDITFFSNDRVWEGARNPHRHPNTRATLPPSNSRLYSSSYTIEKSTTYTLYCLFLLTNWPPDYRSVTPKHVMGGVTIHKKSPKSGYPAL